MKNPKQGQPVDASPANPLAEAMSASLATSFGRSASFLGRNLAGIQKESLRFLNQRLEDNMKAVEEFGACRSLPDMMAVQQRWLSGMTRAYSEEWQRYAGLLNGQAEGEADGHATGRTNGQAGG